MHDSKYADMTTEQVYDIIFEEQDQYKNFVQDILEPGEGSTNDQDSQNTAQGTDKLKEQLTSIIVQAQTQSMMAGKQQGEIPGEVARMIDDLINPKLDWKQLLDRYVSERSKNDFTWMRPNKRFMPNHYLPSMYSETIGNITIAIDTSGSVTQEELTEMLTEIESIRDTYQPEELVVIDCDYIIHGVHKVDKYTDIHDIQFKGEGGTSFDPVFEYCKDNPPNILIYFTDLYAEPVQNNVEYDVLWVCNSDHEPAVIGETIYIND